MAGFQNMGGLGGLGGVSDTGGFFQRPVVQDTLNAVFDSMISSPRNNIMQNFSQSYDNSLERRSQAEQRAAFEQALISAGMDPAQAKMMAASPQAAKFAMDQQETSKTKNTTRTWLLSQGFSEADADAAVANPAILSSIMKKIQGGSDTSYSKTPIYGTDAEGNTVLGVLADDGSFKQIDTGGFNVASGIDKIDMGTQWALYDKRTGQLIGYEPKDLRGAARESAIGGEDGKALGEASATLDSMRSKMPGLETVVKNLDDLAGKATYTLAGQAVDWARAQTGADPRDAAVARAEYTAIVDNQVLPLLRDTFGAQFTQKEGETLRQTLGDPDKTPAEKQAVLRAFIEQKRRDVEALEVRTGERAPGAAVSKPVSEMTDAELEALVNGQ